MKYVLYIFLITTMLYAAFSTWAYDDPFITYRYARNLANGLGFVYNPTERVQSTTTPLFTLLLVLPARLGLDLPRVANLIGALSLALGGLCLWELGRSWNTFAVGWVGLLLYPIFSLLILTLGSETPLYITLCLAAFVCYSRKDYTLTAVFSALAVLARPDGILVAVILVADYLVHKQRPFPKKSIGLFMALTLPWFVFAWLYFGSPLPVTLSAKQHQASMTISQTFLRGFLTLVRGYAHNWLYWLEGALALTGLLFGIKHSPRWALLFAWTILYFASYSILGVSRYFWYYAPLVPGFLILIGLGIETLGHPWLRDRRILWVIVVITLMLSIIQGYNSWQVRQHPDQRVNIYRAIGTWLGAHTPADAVIGTLEVGIIGYYAERPMVDFAGLIQPEVAKHLTQSTTYEDAALWAIERYQPDYVVLRKGDFGHLRQSYIESHCHLTKQFSGEPFGSNTDYEIFACIKSQ